MKSAVRMRAHLGTARSTAGVGTMAPLPPIWDPAKAVDKLPQPFRLIDKILAEIIELALENCLAKDKQKYVSKAAHIDTVFSPHAVVVADGQASCFTTLGVGGMAIVGTLTGEVISHTARDPTLIGRQQAHVSPVTALEIGHIAATGTKIVASACKDRVVVHDVVLRTSELRPLAQVEFPEDPGIPGGWQAPCKVSFSGNAGHLAVCWPSGCVAVYQVLLPACIYDSSSVDRPHDAPPLDLSGGQLKLILHFPLKIITSLLVGNNDIGACNVVWQEQQRPDKSGKGDRSHRPAKGVYMWWYNCNKLALSYLTSDEPNRLKLPPINKPSTPPPSTPPGGAKPGAKGGKPGAAAAPDPAAAPAQPGDDHVIKRSPSKGWLLPQGISHSCQSADGKMLGFGLADGSVVVWDDHFGGHTRILPRMPDCVTALAFVNGAPNLLFVTSGDGSVYLADLNKPEDSHMSKTKLPHAAHHVFFLQNDPFAVCVCFGAEDHQPRLVWFNMQDEKLAAELVGKNVTADNFGFGQAGLRVPPILLPPPVSSGDVAPPAAAPPPATAKGGKPTAPAVAEQAPVAVDAAALEAAAEVAAQEMQLRPWPAVSFRDAYLVAGGPIVQSVSYRPPEDGEPPTPVSQIPTDAHLYLYKLDAIARMLLPEEMAGAASKSLLNRMLADLNPPKIRRGRVKMGVPDPEAPKPPPSAMRKATDVAPDDTIGGRRHIQFNEADLEGLLNEEQKSGKLFKKETIKGGYSDGRSKPITDPSGKPGSGILDLSAFGGAPPAAASNVPVYMQERPQSPPWHHTNPLARIHPDWEEAAVLSRIMEKLGSKGGGRRRRDRRLGTVAREMQTKMAKESGAKPALLPQNNN